MAAPRPISSVRAFISARLQEPWLRPHTFDDTPGLEDPDALGARLLQRADALLNPHRDD